MILQSRLLLPAIFCLVAAIVLRLLIFLGGQNILLQDADYNNYKAKKAYNIAQFWRQNEVNLIHKDYTNDEFDNASRWIAYANPFSEERSCSHKPNNNFVEIVNMQYKNGLLTQTKNRLYLSQHAYHSTGIEGNTLTLPETVLIVNDQKLVAGFEDNFVTPVTQRSIIEVQNFQQVMDALKLSTPPNVGEMSAWKDMTEKILVDINSAIVRDTDNIQDKVSFRTHPVGIGHQRIVLPMPDELPTLMRNFIRMLTDRVRNLMKSEHDNIAMHAIFLACDAHTTFVRMYPFSDGNDRLARILSGLVLQAFGLPASMFIKQESGKYISAVGAATINMKYNDICFMHAEAVRRSLQEIARLS
jgi:hypothetical protein